MSDVFQTPLQEVVFYDRYSRWDPEKGRRETWPETTTRVIDFFANELRERELHSVVPILSDLHEAMRRLEVLPAMRIVQMAGPALKRCNVGAYNCSYLPLDSWKSFADLLYILMQGTGVGFSVEQRYVNQLPPIDDWGEGETFIHTIEDSTEGWCNALLYGLQAWAVGDDVQFDYSQIRPAGAPLKTKGGRASGPEPLKQLLDYTRNLMINRRGKRLTSLDAHDIACFCGSIVQVGGVRRAAEISLSDLNDREMRHAKQGPFWERHPQRSMANNSAVYEVRPDIFTFIDEWKALMGSGTGERGIFNREAVIRTLPGRREVTWDYGTNPCVTGDTIIATVAGPRTFADLAADGKDVLVYAWHPQTKTPVIRWMRNPHRTRVNTSLLEVEFDSGLKVRCTPDHNFYSFRGRKVAAKDLTVGTSIRAWSMSEHRDGQLRVHGWDASANKANHQWVHRMLWEMANGPIPEGMVLHHIDGDPTHNVLSNLMLTDPIEHNRIHYPERAANGFDGHAPNHKVVAIREAGSGDVFNGCVDDAHSYIILDPEPICGVMSGIVSANCGEIVLRPRQFCNLSIVVARPDDTVATLHRKVELAAIWGTLQSLLTNFNYIDGRFKKNCEEERLLGVDITGQMDCPLLAPSYGGAEQKRQQLLLSLRNHARNVNHEWAERLGIARAAAITCVKPSGNSSQLLDVSSGLHPRFAPFYIRRLRLGANNPLTAFLRASGVPLFPEMGQDPINPSVVVAEFPVKAPYRAITRSGMTALNQLENWLVWKHYWCEHNPSCTIYVKDDEWLEVGAWVYRNFNVIGGLSFLPYDGGLYELAPYEEITEEEYNKRVATFPVLDFTQLPNFEKEDMTTVNQEYACQGGSCEI